MACFLQQVEGVDDGMRWGVTITMCIFGAVIAVVLPLSACKCRKGKTKNLYTKDGIWTTTTK